MVGEAAGGVGRSASDERGVRRRVWVMDELGVGNGESAAEGESGEAASWGEESKRGELTERESELIC